MAAKVTPLLIPALLCACASVGPTGAASNVLDIHVTEGTGLAADISPDGRTLTFDLLGQLWLLPAGGGSARAITDAVADMADDMDPSFSRDGKQIVFTAERGGPMGLWLLDLATRTVVPLYRGSDPFSYPRNAAWSPDGARIAFSEWPSPSAPGVGRVSRISVIDVATREVRRIDIDSLPKAELRKPAWAPDGQRIAFIAMTDGDWRGRIWSVSADGGAATPLVPDHVRAVSVDVSPDGQRIAYIAADSAERLQLWLQDLGDDPDTGQPRAARQLTRHGAVAQFRVRWAADGSTLLYSADGKLRRIAVDGSASTEIPFNARLTVPRTRRALPPARFPEPGEVHPARGFTGLALSPDGARIGSIALGKLWVSPLSGSARAIADVPHTARHLTWSPDGAELAWYAGRVPHEDLFATDVATGATRRVTALRGRERFPAYSPDGRWIAFIHTDSVSTRLRVIAARDQPVSDTARTRDLGTVSRGLTASNLALPVWSPESDALLRVVGGQGFDVPTVAELTSLSGTRDTVAAPEAPTSVQWTREGIVWTRHDRLWSVPFGKSGMMGTPRPLGDAPAIYASAATDGSVLFVSEGGLRLRTPAGDEQQLGWPVQYTAPVPAPLLIRNVRIIDGTGTPPSTPSDVLIERGRITRIAHAGSIAADVAKVVDGAGRYAIPGLMDLHDHAMPDLLPGFLYYGITVVRDQGSSIAPLVAYAEMIAAGVIPGPRVSYGGFQFYTDWPFDDEQGRGLEPEADSQHVGRAVALAGAFGAHHIKVRTFTRFDTHATMIAEAHRRGLRVTGHCAQQLPIVAAGIDSKEHLGACDPRYGAETLYGDVIELLRAADIGVVPTLAHLALAGSLGAQPELLDDPELAHFTIPRSAIWMLRLTPRYRAEWARHSRDARATTLRLARAGVTLGTGSDVWQFPTGTHIELEELVAAGLTPMEALRAATSGSARILGADRDLGTIEAGKLADLVLLDADPLADIRNTRRIWMVVKGGAVVDRGEIVEKYHIRR